MIIWLICQLEQAPCPALHPLVQVHLVVAVAAIVTKEVRSSSGSCSEQDNIVTVSDDIE